MPEIDKTDNPPPDAGHEDSDIDVRFILKFSAAMVVVLIVIQFAIAWQWTYFDERIRKSDPKLPPLAAKERARLPQNLERIPEPRLQPFEVRDLTDLRRKEERILAGYQWVDEKNGVVSLPLDRAMELLSTADSARTHGIRIRGDEKKRK